MLQGTDGSYNNDANPVANLIENDSFYQVETATGIDAVSAVLMKDAISNDYVLEPVIPPLRLSKANQGKTTGSFSRGVFRKPSGEGWPRSRALKLLKGVNVLK